MNTNLQELYDEIVKSEMKARLRKEHLTQIKKQIREFEARIQELKSEQALLQGQIVVKVQKISEDEVNHKWITQRYKILEEQKSELSKTRDALVEELETNTAELNCQREKFCEEAQEFCENYFVLGNGATTRKRQAEKEIQKLKDEELVYQLEIKKLEDENNRMDDAQSTCVRLQQEVEELEARCQELDIVLIEENDQLEELLKQKEACKLTPNADPEFRRLQSALQECLQRKLQ